MDRRNFVRGFAAALTGAAGPAGTSGLLPEAAAAGPGSTPAWVAEVRRQMPATRVNRYFQTAAFGPSPEPVIARIKELLDVQMRGPAEPEALRILQEAEDSCRPLIAAAFGARTDEVGLTHNTTEGMNIVIWSIDWRPGDEILTSNQEHPALMLPSYNLRARFGVSHRRAAIDVGEDVVGNVTRQLSRRTRLVALSHVSRRTGRVIPAAELAAALRSRGVRLLLDGAQGAGNTPVDFDRLGCDYYSLCGHKWLLGPKGTGALLVRRDLLDATPVSYTGGHSTRSYDDQGHHEWHPDGRRYEYGTRDQANFGGFAAAMRWLEAIGWEKIYARVREQSLEAARRIQSSKKLGLVSPLDDRERSGLLAVRLPAGCLGGDVVEKLNRDRLLVSPLENPRDLRVSLHFFNTMDEFEALVERLEAYC
jgi:L-cysteine/cystine lyase